MELTVWQILVLAVVQGMTEFLPVSSSGHLVIVAAFLSPQGSTEDLEVGGLNIVLHGGTLLSILVYYWHRIWQLIRQDRRTLGLLVVGTIPTVLVGVPLKIFAGDKLLADPLLAGALLSVTGLMLLAARKQSGANRIEELSYGKSFWIGVGQALAILPGLSRSGTTITAGIRLGLTPAASATFSFLLAIPAIGGACALQAILEMGETQFSMPWWQLVLGAVTSFIIGLGCLAWLIQWIERGRLHYFTWWCVPVGLAVVVWQLLK